MLAEGWQASHALWQEQSWHLHWAGVELQLDAEKKLRLVLQPLPVRPALVQVV